jgi:ABC-type sugar transport system substrate-binding protein
MRRWLIAALLVLGVFAVAPAAHAAAVRVFVQHKVLDYTTWRKAYDELAPVRKKMGVLAQSVYQVADEPNNVIVIHDFATLTKARAFADSPELKAAMEKGGVAGPPTIWFTTRSGH